MRLIDQTRQVLLPLDQDVLDVEAEDRVDARCVLALRPVRETQVRVDEGLTSRGLDRSVVVVQLLLEHAIVDRLGK